MTERKDVQGTRAAKPEIRPEIRIVAPNAKPVAPVPAVPVPAAPMRPSYTSTHGGAAAPARFQNQPMTPLEPAKPAKPSVVALPKPSVAAAPKPGVVATPKPSVAAAPKPIPVATPISAAPISAAPISAAPIGIPVPDMGGEALMAGYLGLSEAAGDGFRAAAEAGAILVKGAEKLGREMAAFADQALEAQAEAVHGLAHCSSLEALIEAQSSLAKASLGRFVAQTEKLSELTFAIARESFAPLGARMDAAAERLIRTIAP